MNLISGFPLKINLPNIPFRSKVVEYKPQIKDVKDRFVSNPLLENYDEEIVVEVMPLENFYAAEDYHQDYLDKNPNGYCHLPLELFEYAKKFSSK